MKYSISRTKLKPEDSFLQYKDLNNVFFHLGKLKLENAQKAFSSWKKKRL